MPNGTTFGRFGAGVAPEFGGELYRQMTALPQLQAIAARGRVGRRLEERGIGAGGGGAMATALADIEKAGIQAGTQSARDVFLEGIKQQLKERVSKEDFSRQLQILTQQFQQNKQLQELAQSFQAGESEKERAAKLQQVLAQLKMAEEAAPSPLMQVLQGVLAAGVGMLGTAGGYALGKKWAT